MQNLLKIRSGGDVKRFHTVTMHREHLVASHSWGVAVIMLYVRPDVSREALKAALYHDVPEASTGDMPATTKWANPKLARALEDVEEQITDELGICVHLSEDEQALLKFCDMADLILCCLKEYELGNRAGLEIANRGLQNLCSKKVPARCAEFLAQLCELVNTIGGQ